jgi:Glycosyltransferase family 87
MEPALRSGSAGTEALPPPGAWRATRLVWPAALLGLAIWGVLLAARGRGSDFAIYVRAGSRFLRGEPIYRASDGAWVFKYAPPSAVMFIPFASLPIRIATALWNLLLVGSLALLKPMLAALFEPGPGEPRAPLSGPALAISSIAVGQSLFLELFYGQIDVPMLLLLVASASFAERGRPAMAGAAWAIAVSFKPTAVLFGVYLITRRPRAILIGLAAGVALWIPALLRYGLSGAWDLAASWGDTVSRTTPAWILGSNAQGLPTLLLLGYPGVPLAAHVVAAQLLALGLASAMLWLMRRSRPHLLAGACFSVAFTSALAWRANFALALPMVALAWTDRSRARSLAFALAALAGLVQLTVVEGVLGAKRHEAALLARPFGLTFGALFVWTVISALRSTRRARESASALADAHRRATTPRGGP